ncbi:MAG: heme-binding protein [Chthoniobacteraceae bacterium]
MKPQKAPLILSVVIPLALALFWFASTSRAATEKPEYKVIRTDGKVEVRDYPALTVATTPMVDGDKNSGFRQLFRFITGSNDGAEKIEMTAPVLIDSAKDKQTMSFIMPKNAVAKGVPKPSAKNVTLGKVGAARYAVLQFSGGRNAENETKALAKLKVWLVAQKIRGLGEPTFAYYDPPWVPTFLRRNEVMMHIAKAP